MKSEGGSELGIVEWLQEQTGLDVIPLDADLCNDLGIDGDDMFELIEQYSKRFEVNVSSYVWYFHHGDEASIGCNPLMIFIRNPFSHIVHIPLTPRMLMDYANEGAWNLNYPDHEIPDRTMEFRMARVFMGILCLLALLIGFARWKN